jgi:hypothetical protein
VGRRPLVEVAPFVGAHQVEADRFGAKGFAVAFQVGVEPGEGVVEGVQLIAEAEVMPAADGEKRPFARRLQADKIINHAGEKISYQPPERWTGGLTRVT